MRNALRRYVPYGLRQALKLLVTELRLAAMQRGARRKAARVDERGARINLGCGPRAKAGWVNIDLEHGDLRLDLRDGLPLPDGMASLIYSEHCVEHIDYPEPVSRLLSDCHRVLEPGGRLRLAVPDMELVLRAYVEGGDPAFYEAQRRWNPADLVTQMEHVNYNFRQAGEHRYAYDFETLSRLLERCGFEAIERSEYHPELDSEDRVVGSLYVTARKPDGTSNGQSRTLNTIPVSTFGKK